jgi:2-methylcitrate dehydratase PrpD
VPQTLTHQLAVYAASTCLENIPQAVQERARRVVFDEMASAQFGRRSPGGSLAARYAQALGGTGEARILGSNLRVPAPYAALANGSAGHGEEVDGAHVIGGHPGATLVHACVALAERQHSSGAELLNAVVLAYDIAIRLVEACGGKFNVKKRHHLYADFLFGVGAALACGRLLRLAPPQLAYAMALATFQTNALACLYQEARHISKSFCNGQFALAGVSAALMAEAGFEGVDDVLGTSDGLLAAWGSEGAGAAVVRDLGTDWSIMGHNFKFINAGYPIHACVEAATGLAQEMRIAPQEIASVVIGMPENAMRIVNGRDMHNICAQDNVAAALLRGRPSLRESPFPSVLDDPAFVRLRPRVDVAVDPDLNRDQPDGRGANVTITTEDGRRAARRVDAPRGHASRGGASWEDLAEKWRDGLPHADMGHAMALSRKLEQLADVRTLADAFQAAPSQI